MVGFNTDGTFNAEAYQRTEEHKAVEKFVKASKKLGTELQHPEEGGTLERATNVYKQAKTELQQLFKDHEANFSKGDHTLISQYTRKDLVPDENDIDRLLNVSDSVTDSAVRRAFEGLENDVGDSGRSFLKGKIITDQTKLKKGF